jgi:hypothetical protein
VTLRADDLSGVVVSVEVAGKKIVVMEQATSRPVDIGFVDRAVIQTTSGLPLQVQNLKRGDRVGIVYTGGRATRVVVNQVPLKGVVSSTDLRGEKMVVTEEGTNRDIDVVMSPATRLETTAHEPIALKDVKTGDGIGVVFSGAAPIEIRIDKKPPELTGHIKSIGGDMRSLIVTELGTDADVTVAISPKTRIVSKAGKTLGMNDLRKGDGVGIAHHASVASLIVVNPVTTP